MPSSNIKQLFNLAISPTNGTELTQEDRELVELLAAVMANRDKFRVILEQNNPNTDNFKDQINTLVEEHLKSAGIDDNTINSMKDKIQNMEPQEFDKYLTTAQLANIIKDYAKTEDLPDMTKYVTNKVYDDLANIVSNIQGQGKAFYNNEYLVNGTAIKKINVSLTAALTSLKLLKSESDKNKDSLTDTLQHFNDFQKQYMTEEDTEAKFRIVNDLINDIKTQLANLVIPVAPVSPITLSTERTLWTFVKGSGGPEINPIDHTIAFGAKGQQVELEETLSNKAADYEIVADNDDPRSFYVPEYRNNQSPLRASLTTKNFSIQVHGEDAKFEIFCLADDVAKMGHFEIRKKYQAN